MPLIKSASPQAKSENIRREMASGGKKQSQAVAIALDVARRASRAAGGAVTGPLIGDIPGRTDHKPIKVPDGAYVLPADVVSGLGEGNTFAGMKSLDNMFKAGPYGTKIKKVGAKARVPRSRARPSKPRFGFAAGGLAEAGMFDPPAVAETPPVDIEAADGEYVVDPETVENIGGGDLSHGHRILDAYVKLMRKKTIATLKKLPGPAKS